MKFILVIFFLIGINLTCSSQTKKSQKCIACNTQIVLETNNKIERLAVSDIHCFLKSVDSSCSNNIEYSEFSNEVLFKIVQKYPNEFIEALSMSEVNVDHIIEELKKPIIDHDLHEIKLIYVNNVKESGMSVKVIDALDKALINN